MKRLYKFCVTTLIFLFALIVSPDAFCKEKDTFLKDYRKTIDELETLSKSVSDDDGDREKFFKKVLEDFSVRSAALQDKVKRAGFGDVFFFDKYPSAIAYAWKNRKSETVNSKDNGKKLSFSNQVPSAEFVFDLMRYDVNALKKLKFSYADGTIDGKYRKYPCICKFRYCYEYYKRPVKAEKGKYYARGVFEQRLELMRKAAKDAEAEAKKNLPESFLFPPFGNDAEMITGYYLKKAGAWQSPSAHASSKRLMMNNSADDEYAFLMKSTDDFFKRFDKFVTDEEKARSAAERAEKKAEKEAEKEERKRGKSVPPEKISDERTPERAVEEEKEKKSDDADAVIWRNNGGSGVWK